MVGPPVGKVGARVGLDKYGLEGKWLDEGLEKEEVLEMTGAYPEEKMQAHTISKLITSRKEDSNVKEVQEEFEYPELESHQRIPGKRQ